MCTNKVIVVLALACFAIANTEFISRGPCPSNISVRSSFYALEYMGLWYEYAKYPTAFEEGGKCITAQYTLRADGNINVTNSQINESTEVPYDINGIAVPVENAKLMVTFPVSPSYNATSNYWVLATDYYTYSVVYSCQPLDSAIHGTTIWILTRDRVPSTETVDAATNVLVQKGFYLEPLVKTVQNGCI